MKKLTRRDFLKGASITAGAGAVTALTGCKPKSAETAEPTAAAASNVVNADAPEMLTAGNYNTVKWSFEIEPEPIDDSEITETYTADVIVVGSGMAGLCTAVSAQENGVDVMLFSASSKPVGRGGSNHGIGSKLQKELGIDYDAESCQALMQEEIINNSNKVDQRKWMKWINNSAEAMDWQIDIMAEKGLQVGLEHGYNDPNGIQSSPPASHNFFNEEQPFGALFGAPLQAKAYADTFEERGGTIHYNTVGKYLIRGGEANGKSGRVEAVIAQDADGNYVKYEANKAVVLATGDFSKDHDMMAKFCPEAFEYFGKNWNTDVDYDMELNFTGLMPGDGHKMGLWAGAAWQRIAPVAPMINSGVPGPSLDSIANFNGINLAIDGKRFHNEVVSFGQAGIALMYLPGDVAFGIWDTDYAYIKEEYFPFGTLVDTVNGIQPSTPEDLIAGWDANVESGTYFKADTLEELVAQLPGIDQEAALESIERYNQYAEQGLDEEFHKAPEVLFPIKTGPFYASKTGKGSIAGATVPCFLTVCGGLRTNDKMQVCAEDDTPIEGLYNVGIMTGDFYANSYSFVVFGQNLGSTCLVFPYMLGKDLAEL